MVSVINQMLKDLDQRSPEQGQATLPATINHKPSTIKIILISLTVLVSLNILGFYIWNLQERITSSELKIEEQAKAQKPIARVSLTTPQQPTEISSPNQTTMNQINPSKKALVQHSSRLEGSSLKDKVDHLSKVLPQKSSIKEKAKLSVPESESFSAIMPVVQTNIQPVTIKAKQVKLPTKSQISVSRRQLSPTELVAQKLARAEKALQNNKVLKAEELFEDVLIIEPKHKETRKKLAALWFGRKLYQQATNLLSQGISLDRSDAELRLLKAKIHLQQGNNQAAYETLTPLALLKQRDYQVMLANVSQQIEQYNSAIQAYKILIDMQEYSGRWHLGLAIVYDKSAQFSSAVTEYAVALTKTDLSIASAEFAQQRMQALGE